MKNKKLISRIFALSAALVLVVALALPCFADENTDSKDWNTFYFYIDEKNPEYNDNLAYRSLKNADYNEFPINPIESLVLFSYVPIIGDSFYIYGAVGFYASSDSQDLYELYHSFGKGYVSFRPSLDSENPLYEYMICGLRVRILPTAYVEYYFEDENGDRALSLYYEYSDGDYLLTTVVLGDIDIEVTDQSVLDGAVIDFAYVVVDFDVKASYDYIRCLTDDTFSVEYPSGFASGYASGIANAPDGDTSNEPTRSGMFGQLYYILRDAIYGENVVIDSTQDFSLTLVCTLLVLCTVLLPVIVVVAFLFKAFR